MQTPTSSQGSASNRPRFTPGPWRVIDDGDDGDPILHIVSGPDDVVLASLIDFTLDEDRCDANANLIAEAPAMHALLGECADWLGRSELPRNLELAQKIRAVVAKAEGR